MPAGVMGRAINRRNFLRKYLLGSGQSDADSANAALPFDNALNETGALAALRGYRHDALEVDTQKFPGRLGEQGELQYCFNCLCYKGGTDEAWAACDTFPGRKVAGRGWCNAWAQNPE